jgi:hypothetical protein
MDIFMRERRPAPSSIYYFSGAHAPEHGRRDTIQTLLLSVSPEVS